MHLFHLSDINMCAYSLHAPPSLSSPLNVIRQITCCTIKKMGQLVVQVLCRCTLAITPFHFCLIERTDYKRTIFLSEQSKSLRLRTQELRCRNLQILLLLDDLTMLWAHIYNFLLCAMNDSIVFCFNYK